MRTSDNTRKITIDQGDDCATGSLLDCPYFIGNYKLIAIYLSKHQTYDTIQILLILC